MKEKSGNRSVEGGDSAVPEGLGARFEELARVMAELRSPGGCPWDIEQTPQTLTRHMLEEAYEAVEAIDHSDWEHLEEELGDLLLQIMFQSRIAEERQRFDIGSVVVGITEKLKRRHPHIFGDVELDSSEEVVANWERIKCEQEGKSNGMELPAGLPALLSAEKIQRKAARQGFDWDSVEGVFEKLDEEIEELREVAGGLPERVEEELGDLLFTAVNLARHLGVEPERSLRSATREFVNRYRQMEEQAEREGASIADLTMEEKDELWERAKEKRARGVEER